MKERGMDDNDY
jgi:crotonobetainyl-CoA:carnitine CoA-transferase CaiB-like acyl-CoA transferase